MNGYLDRMDTRTDRKNGVSNLASQGFDETHRLSGENVEHPLCDRRIVDGLGEVVRDGIHVDVKAHVDAERLTEFTLAGKHAVVRVGTDARQGDLSVGHGGRLPVRHNRTLPTSAQITASGEKAGNGLHGVAVGPNFVGAHTPGVMKGEISRQGHGARIAFEGRTVLPVLGEKFTKEALATNSPQDTKVGKSFLEGVNGVHELPVVLGSLGETNARVDDDAPTVDSSGNSCVDLLGGLRNDVGYHVVIVDKVLHSGGLTAPVHENVIDASVGNDIKDFRFSLAPRDVVDDGGSCLDNSLGH